MDADGTFVISKEREGGFRHRLLSMDGILLTSSKYASVRTCRAGVQSTRFRARDPERYFVCSRPNGKVFFQLKSRNSRVLGESPDYKRMEDLEAGRELFAALAEDATLEVQTRLTESKQRDRQHREVTSAPNRYMIFSIPLGPDGYRADETNPGFSEGFLSPEKRDARWKWIEGNSDSKQKRNGGAQYQFLIVRANTGGGIPRQADGGRYEYVGERRYSDRQLVGEVGQSTNDEAN